MAEEIPPKDDKSSTVITSQTSTVTKSDDPVRLLNRIPCAKFDLTDESHQRSCFHYSNLQPLFVTDNRRKHAKMPESHQAELV